MFEFNIKKVTIFLTKIRSSKFYSTALWPPGDGEPRLVTDLGEILIDQQ